MPSLVLNETTLFYLNLSMTATTASNSFSKVKNWTSHVAKASHRTKPNSAHAGSSKSSSVPSKRTTSSTSALVVTHPQPERKKIKLDNHNLTTSGFLEEDEAVEREAAISSPVKGGQRLNSKVCHVSNHNKNANLSVVHRQSRKSVTTSEA